MSIHGPFVYRKAIRYNSPGHLHFYTFSCNQRLPILTNDRWCQWLAESIAYARKKLEYELWAYVFMPEHVHLLLKPLRQEYRISEFMQLAKNPVARRVINDLKKAESPLLQKIAVTDRFDKIEYRYWLPGGGYDFNVLSKEVALHKAEYCHYNPVKRGLVTSPELWKWSSYRRLAFGARENEPIAVDEWKED